MRKNGTLNYILSDHLGSTSTMTNASGAMISQLKYKAWGETRYASGTNPTKYTYTGQYSYASDFGLMFYNARWYDSLTGRFIQADTIVPAGVQGLDRYAYVNNSPINYTDPSGHMIACEADEDCNHGYQSSPLNPWRRPASESAIGRDKAAYMNEDFDQLFLNHASSPVRNGTYSGFGGCSTYEGCNGEYHPAVDSTPYTNPEGTPIYAMAYGTVVAVGFEDYGYFVMIEHCVTPGNCVYSVYAHLEAGSIQVSVGDVVGSNMQIAGMGNTIDKDSGPTSVHLHLEVRRASNVNLNNPSAPVSNDYQSDPPFVPAWWGTSRVQLNALFVDLGPLFGYHEQYSQMPFYPK